MLDIITSYQELVRLEDQWNQLVAEVNETSPFVTHAWTCAWWEAFGGESRLHLLIMRKGDRICGLAPLMFSRVQRCGLPVRRLGTLYNLHVQRTSFPVLEDCGEEFCHLVWKHVHSLASTWDVLELSPFHRLSPTLSVVEKAAVDSQLTFHYWTEGHSPFVDLSGNWDTYLKTLSSNRRGNFQRQFKKLAELGEISLELITGGDLLDAALEDAYRIEAMGWKSRSGTAISCDPALKGFYDKLATRLAAKDSLRLYFLRVGEKRVAVQYCVEENNKLYVLKPGYDPEFARFSPSQLLVWKILEAAFARNIVEFDLLGDADEWKLVWAKKTREVSWMIVYSKSLRGRVVQLLKLHVARWVRRIRGLRQPVQRPAHIIETR